MRAIHPKSVELLVSMVRREILPLKTNTYRCPRSGHVAEIWIQRREVNMIGLTVEITSILEAMEKLHHWTLVTYGKAPRKFHLGPDEYGQFLKEIEQRFSGEEVSQEELSSWRFLGVPIERAAGSGIDASLH